jgi:hypothetical protein
MISLFICHSTPFSLSLSLSLSLYLPMSPSLTLQVLESMAQHRSEMTSSLDKSMSMAREQQRQQQQPPVAKVVVTTQPGKGTHYTGMAGLERILRDDYSSPCSF